LSADSVTQIRQPARPPRLPEQTQRAGGESIHQLAERMRPVVAIAVDADEVAAVLEASGINDRVARNEYDVTSVFSLASLLLQSGSRTAEQAAIADVESRTLSAPIFPVRDTLIRAALYLTPTVVALGAAAHVGGLPAITTKGALVFGWGIAQALAFLGYCVLGTDGRAAAARLLAVGFVVATVAFTAVLWQLRVPWPAGYVISGAQLALFASTAVALVTGTERRVLACAVPCWLSAGAMALGYDRYASAALLASLSLMLLVAYLPGFRRSTFTWPRARQLAAAVGYGAVGTGQAILFVLVVLTGSGSGLVPIDAVPLLVGVPLTELLLVWHQRRVADGRARLDDRAAFGRHLKRVSRGTVVVLALPVLAGAALCVPVLAGNGLFAGRLDALPGQPRIATAVLLTGVFALCLVLVTHRRLVTAAILVWWPAALIALTGRMLPQYAHLPLTFTNWVTGLTLFAVCLPALVVVALVIRDPWSYR
jgi:hypothetical protein